MNLNLNKFVFVLTMFMSVALGLRRASAAIWTEAGDAGQLPVTAQITVGAGGLTSIFGTLPTDPLFSPDIDLFLIRITDPDSFSATTVNAGTEFLDTQLYLFRADGVGVVANGNFDSLAGEFRAAIPVGALSSPSTPVGDYLLGIALFESRPTNSTGQFLFPDLVFSDAVESPVLADPLGDWSTLPIFEPFLNYQIDLTGADFAAVPEPTSMICWFGILGIAALRARRGKGGRGVVIHHDIAAEPATPNEIGVLVAH